MDIIVLTSDDIDVGQVRHWCAVSKHRALVVTTIQQSELYIPRRFVIVLKPSGGES